ncbi:MAG: response regulator [bacterium]|nr:response regulator [bacterium]
MVQPNRDGAHKRVLIVDDELSVREILAQGLGAMGYETFAAGSASEAFDILKDEAVHIVLSDIEMPGEDGIELLSRIKRHDGDLDVIMVTGVVDARTAIHAIRNGATDYVAKPFNLEEVQIVIDRTLEKRRLVEENRAYQEHLEELVDQRTREVQKAYESTLQALVTALDFRDNETQGHSYRVVEYAMLVAERMGVQEPELTWIRRGAILHDTGKIGVPDAILKKPGRLDTGEWVEMKKHPEMGFRMLQHIPFLEPALNIVLCHHERYDGSGYPRKLKADDIPLGARIFAVVDTFDAMTSDRPYRAALTIEDACKEIVRCTGTQFDPGVSQAFLSIEAHRWQAIRDRVHREMAELEEQVKKAMR